MAPCVRLSYPGGQRRNSRDRPGPVGGACAEREDHCGLLRRRRGGVLGRRPHRRAPRHRDRPVARRPRIPPLHVVGPDHAAARVALGAARRRRHRLAARHRDDDLGRAGAFDPQPRRIHPGAARPWRRDPAFHRDARRAPARDADPARAPLGCAYRRRADHRRRPRADGRRRADQHRHACARRRHAVHRGRAVLGLDADAACACARSTACARP